MWLSKSDNAILSIEQQGAVFTDASGNRFWNLHWEIYPRPGYLLRQQDVTLSEPFSPPGYDQVAEYLNSSLDNEYWDQSDANSVSNTIDTFRNDLLEQLDLLDSLRTLRGKRLEIHIWPEIGRVPGTRSLSSIHSIHWEQLENLNIWPEESRERLISVTVCRHVHAKSADQVRPARSVRNLRQARHGTFDVLLVVARPHIHEIREQHRNGYSILNPATVRSVLLQLQEELSSMKAPQQIRLETVNPGCWDELERRLEKRRSHFGRENPFHLIHFDMHGALDLRAGPHKSSAYVQFNNYIKGSSKLGVNNVYARKLARLLCKYDIDCVIFNVCKSAVADGRLLANLSAFLVNRGISAVLGMSYNVHDSTLKRFYTKFYAELFMHHASISTAASEARRVLFVDRKRWHYGKRVNFFMQDWFIPVVYNSSEEPYRFPNYRPWDPGTLFGIPLLELVLSVIASICIFQVVNTKFFSSIVCRPTSISQTTMISLAPLFWTIIGAGYRFRCEWIIRQRLRVLAEDRQNGLRIESDLLKKKIVFFYSQEDIEEDARPFLECLAHIWERTNFVLFGGAIDAEWFVQPEDLHFQNDWKLWVKACANRLCLWVYSLQDRHYSFTEEAKSVVIIDNVDALYPEKDVLREVQYYASAQRQFEEWLQKHFIRRQSRTPPLLLLTALRGRSLGDNVSKWLEEGPGRCGVLDSVAITVFVEKSSLYVDPTNATLDKDKWYDGIASWFCGDVARPAKRGFISALWDLPQIVFH